MRHFFRPLCFISFVFAAAVALAQNGAYSAYYSYSTTYNSDGSATVTPTAEVTGTDDVDDWVEGWRPVCNLGPKIQLTGDANWVSGPAAALGKAVDYVRTGQPIQIPADGSTVNVQFAVEVDVHCTRPPTQIYYKYPSLETLDTWSDIDPNQWFLVGFGPPQTNPSSPFNYCPSPDSCPVGIGVASVPNFVDFADFVNFTARIAVTTYAISTVNADGTATYTLSCPNGNQNATCGEQNYFGSEPFNWAEEFQLYTRPGGCWPLGIIQYKNGPPAPYPCR